MLDNEGAPLKRVIVCSPRTEYFDVPDLQKHNITQIANRESAIRQHNTLKALMREAGAEVIDLPELPGHPNSVFTQDTAFVTPQGYIRMRMGLDTRRGEENWMSSHLEQLVEPCIGEISGDGTVEGGDIIMAGNVAFIGHSTRTNLEGIRQLSEIFNRIHVETRVVRIPSPYLHIGGAMSVIDQNQILCCRGIFPDGFFDGFDIVEIDSDSFISGNVITLGNRSVIADIRNNAAKERLETIGYNVHPTNLSEFVKGTGGPSCLIMPLERG